MKCINYVKNLLQLNGNKRKFNKNFELKYMNDYKDKSYYNTTLANRDQTWASIRSSRMNIDPVVLGDRVPVSTDFDLLFNCMYLVLMELDIFNPNPYSKTEEKNNELSLEDKIKSVHLEVILLKSIYDKSTSLDYKERSLETLKKTIWQSLRSKKVDIMKVMVKFPYLSDLPDTYLLHQCIVAILYILELDDKEIDILSSTI